MEQKEEEAPNVLVPHHQIEMPLVDPEIYRHLVVATIIAETAIAIGKIIAVEAVEDLQISSIIIITAAAAVETIIHHHHQSTLTVAVAAEVVVETTIIEMTVHRLRPRVLEHEAPPFPHWRKNARGSPNVVAIVSVVPVSLMSPLLRNKPSKMPKLPLSPISPPRTFQVLKCPCHSKPDMPDACTWEIYHRAWEKMNCIDCFAKPLTKRPVLLCRKILFCRCTLTKNGDFVFWNSRRWK